MKSVEYLAKKLKKLKEQRQPWNSQFQILGQYIYSRKQEFQSEHQDGSFLNDGAINDSTASRSLQAMASAITGALWKGGGKTFILKRPDHIPDNSANKEFYEKMNKRFVRYMESEKAGFELAFDETIKEEGCFGTGGLGCFEGDHKHPLRFKSWGLQSLYIDESEGEFVDVMYYVESLTVEQVVNRYGLDQVSEDVRKKYQEEKSLLDKVTVCVAIEPRTVAEQGKGKGNTAMPFGCYHFEVEKPHLLKESGYEELPVKVSRWYKCASEVYGRSPGMDALPTIMQLNAFKEAFLVGVEKKVEPPLYVTDDGSLGAATVDTSAGGLSVFNVSGRLDTRQPVGVIFDVGELQSIQKAIEDLKGEVAQHFFIDKLYDLNNKTRMTLGEAEMRYDIRSDSLSSVFSRIFNEQLTPIIERAFNICFDMGLLGVREEDTDTQNILLKAGIDPLIIPPDVVEAIKAGKDIYFIEYVSPAARILRETERRGVAETVNLVALLAPGSEEAMDSINVHQTIQIYRDLNGAPSEMMNSLSEALARKQARDQARQEALEVQKTQMEADSARNVAQAQSMVANPNAGGKK